MQLQHLKECDCMKNYYMLILNRLLDIYEKREVFLKIQMIYEQFK